jgi:hypothetical protein
MKPLPRLPSAFLGTLASFLIWAVSLFGQSPAPPEKFSSTPPQHLELEAGLSGPTIHALFGRFPNVSANCDQNGIPSWSRTSRSSGLNVTFSTCTFPSCNYGSSPTGDCFTNKKAHALNVCSYNNACTNYDCTSSTSGCCNQCVWLQTDCYSCTTIGHCN